MTSLFYARRLSRWERFKRVFTWTYIRQTRLLCPLTECIRFIGDSRPGDVPQSIIEWVDRLAFHTERIESKCALALTARAE